MRMETRTVTLRLVVASRDFSKRRKSLDVAVNVALAGAALRLLDHSFIVESQGAKIVDEGNVINEGCTINDE